MGGAHQGSAIEVPPVGDRGAARQQRKSVRPHRRKSARRRDRRGVREGITADSQYPPVAARPVSRSDLTIRTGRDHMTEFSDRPCALATFILPTPTFKAPLLAARTPDRYKRAGKNQSDLTFSNTVTLI
jgi:hypothetical protein